MEIVFHCTTEGKFTSVLKHSMSPSVCLSKAAGSASLQPTACASAYWHSLCLPVGQGEQDIDNEVQILWLLLLIKSNWLLVMTLKSQMPFTHILELGEGQFVACMWNKISEPQQSLTVSMTGVRHWKKNKKTKHDFTFIFLFSMCMCFHMYTAPVYLCAYLGGVCILRI